MRKIRLLPLAAALLIAGCDGDTAELEQSDGGSASGEILPASVSDEMILTDDLQSQPPRLVEADEEGGAISSGGARPAASAPGEDATDESEPEADPEPESDEDE